MSLRYDPSLVAQVGGRARQAMQRPVVLPRSDPPSRMTTHGECRGASPFARSLRVSLSAWAIRARYPSGLTVSTKYPVTLVLQVLSPDGTLRFNSIRRAAQWRCYSTGAPGRPAAPQTALTPSFICQEGCRFLPSGIISTLGVVTGPWLPTQAGSVSDGAVDGTSSPGTTLAATEFQDSDPRAHVGRIVERHLHCPKLFRR